MAKKKNNNIDSKKSSNSRIDEETEKESIEYKEDSEELDEENSEELTDEEKKRKDLVSIVMIGSLIYLLIGIFILVIAIACTEYIYIAVGCGIIIFSLAQLILVYAVENLPKFLKGLLYIINSIPAIIMAFFSGYTD